MVEQQIQLKNVDDVAAMLSLPTSTIYTMIRTKSIPFIKVGRRRLFDPVELAKWLEEKKVSATQIEQTPLA